MKLTTVIAITLATAFGIIWCVQIWSSGRWNTGLQGEGNGTFFEVQRTNNEAMASVREAMNDEPNINPVTDAAGEPRPSSVNWLQNIVEHCVTVIKSAGHRIHHQSHLAPPGVYFTLTYISVRKPSGILGVEPGTQVVCVKDEGPMLLVKIGNLEFEAKRQYLTNDLDVADLAVRHDAEAQQAVASYMAQQQRAIEQRNDKKENQPSGQH